MSQIFLPLILGLLFIFAVFAGAALVIWLLVTNCRRNRQKTTINPGWISVEGQITATGVEESIRTRADDDPFHYPSIEFEYMVEGRPYVGRQAVGKPFNVQFKARRTLEDYPVGGRVVVFYNPEEPGEARLANR